MSPPRLAPRERPHGFRREEPFFCSPEPDELSPAGARFEIITTNKYTMSLS
jgi:hypothetical protein